MVAYGREAHVGGNEHKAEREGGGGQIGFCLSDTQTAEKEKKNMSVHPRNL